MFLFDRKLVCYLIGLSNYPAAGTPRRLLVGRLVPEEEEAVCCVSQVAYASSIRAGAVLLNGRLVLGWLSVLVGPAVAYCPNRRRVVAAILSSLVQRGCGVAPGRGRW